MRLEHMKCNLCGLDDTSLVGKRRSLSRGAISEIDIVRCNSCGLIYPDPMPRFAFQEIQNKFGDPVAYFPGFVTASRIRKCEWVLRQIERLEPAKGRLLDVGCGRGEFLYAAGLKGWEALGTDISERFVKFAKETFAVNALAGDIESLNFEKESFDVACLNSVIQYVPDPLKTFRSIAGLLKRDGLLYIEVTNEDALIFKVGDIFESIVNREKVTTHLSPLSPSFQIYGFNKKALKKALDLTGFEIVNIRIKGIFGGGRVEGKGIINIMINLVRRLIILVGGLTGYGHLLYCTAKKKRTK